MPSRLRHLLVFALALAALALGMPGVAAASGDDVLQDCLLDGRLDKEYSKQELRDAREQMNAEQEDYSDCDDIIDGRLQPKAGASVDGPDDGDEADRAGGADGNGPGGGSSGGGGASDGSGLASGSNDSSDSGPGSPSEEAQKRQLARADTEQKVGERAFDPRNGAAVNAGGTSNGLPFPVLLALIALTVLLAAGVLLAVHQRNPALMGALRRVPFPRRRR